jgi:hypothetical protein
MNPVIRARRAPCRPASPGEWRDAHTAAAEATFFHGPAWSEIWSAWTGGRMRPAPEVVELEGGRTAVLGITEERRRGGRVIRHLSPGGTYGGWVSAFPLGPDDERRLAEAVMRRGSVIWRQAPFASRLHLTPRTVRAEGGETHVIPLSDGAEAARGRWREKARGRVNKARKAGVLVREASSPADWSAYHSLYRAALDRFAEPSSIYDETLFELVRAVGRGGARLYLAELDGTLLAGALVLHAHGYATGWHQASSREGVAGVANLLHWEITGMLADEGFRFYDMNPSGGHAGSAEFKERMGAARRPAPLVVRPGRVDRSLTAAGRIVRGRAR